MLDKYRAGTFFDICIPTWRAGEALIFIEKLARKLGVEKGKVLFEMTWTGLANRELFSIGNPNRVLFNGRKSRQNEIRRQLLAPVDGISDTLPELVHTLLEPVYELFDFFSLPKKLVEEELHHMCSRAY